MILLSPKPLPSLSVYAPVYHSTNDSWAFSLLTHGCTYEFLRSIGLYRAKTKVQGKLWVSREVLYSSASGPAYYYVL